VGLGKVWFDRWYVIVQHLVLPSMGLGTCGADHPESVHELKDSLGVISSKGMD
jgi:hypothetical protein